MPSNRLALLLGALIAALGPLPLQAQPVGAGAASAPGTAPRPAPFAERVRALGLPTLEGGRLTTFHAEGAADRARALRQRTEEALDFFRERLGLADPPLQLAVLNAAQWSALRLGQPYGIPGVAGNPPVAFLPAGDDGEAATDALALAGRGGPGVQALLAEAGIGYEDAARRYVDLVALHELGHVLTVAYGIRPPSRWMNEWLATFFAYAFLREKRPFEAAMWRAVLQTYVDAVQPQHRTLADFDRLYFGVGANNYVWYQAQFQQGIERALQAHGLGLLATLREAFPATAGASPPLSPAAVLERLDAAGDRAGALRDWLRGFDATGTAR